MKQSRQNNSMNEGIAIIGIGCIFPKSLNRDTYWENIIKRVDGITEVPQDRWDIDLYYHPDRTMPDKSYSKIGGFVDRIDTRSISAQYRIPPRTVEGMDRAQKYAIIAAGEALSDSGYDTKDFDRERTSVIIGNSMGGDKNDYSNLRIFYSSIEDGLSKCRSFSTLDRDIRQKIVEEFESRIKSTLPLINEDTMPGELSNVISGRIANALNLNGPSFTVDAACASSMAALSEAVKGLRMGDFDMAICGGSDFLMGPGPYVKFCKIGALSADGSMPFDAKANGFVMGEGVGMYLLKRVSDARRDGDRIYAIVRGIGASSDGKGKGITAPNPKGQMLAIQRALESTQIAPETVQLIEAHGTSTSVGDAVEAETLCRIWDSSSIKKSSIGLGSVKSMIGHLKAAAGSASIIKTALALHNKVVPPSLNFETPNPNIDFGNIPFRVITEPEDWPEGIDGNPRRANVSAFGFGGTNFHVVMEEDAGDNGVQRNDVKYFSPGYNLGETDTPIATAHGDTDTGTPEHGAKGIEKSHEVDSDRYALSDAGRRSLAGEAIVLGGASPDIMNDKIDELTRFLSSSRTDTSSEYRISMLDLLSQNSKSNGEDFRLGIAADSGEDLYSKLEIAKRSLHDSKRWSILQNKGIFFGSDLLSKKDNLGKIAFLFPGQGTQYVNMLKDLYHKYQAVRDTFNEADDVMKDIIGRRLSELIFLREDASDDEKRDAEQKLKQTEVTQPAILTADVAMYRLITSYGIKPDIVAGHSLGEYGALIAAGVLSFQDALTAVAARGKEIANVQIDDVGKMASISTDYKKVEDILKEVNGYVIPANMNCYSQTVISGDSEAVLEAISVFTSRGIDAQEIPVSHAFHSRIVAPACASYRRVLEKLDIKSPTIDILANIDAEYYPRGDGAPGKIVDILEKHIANPVLFVKQIERMYRDGVRIFVEIGPKRALTSFVMNIIDKRPHLAVATNHPKKGGAYSFNTTLAALATYGYDIDWNGKDPQEDPMENPGWRYRDGFPGKEKDYSASKAPVSELEYTTRMKSITSQIRGDSEKGAITNMTRNEITARGYDPDAPYESLFRKIQDRQEELMRESLDVYSRKSSELMRDYLDELVYRQKEMKLHNINLERVMISGVAMGLPGIGYSVFDDKAYDRLANGVNMIHPLTEEEKEIIANKKIVRLVKNSDGEAAFQTIDDKSEVVKLAGKRGNFDFERDYGFGREFSERLDISTKLAISAGIEALKDAGIPLVMNYKTTTTNKLLPSYWGLPESVGEDTGIIFASAFPGYDSLFDELTKNFIHKYGTKAKGELIELYTSIIERVKDAKAREQLSDWFNENYSALKAGSGEEEIFQFNRGFIFKILAMGHSQLAEIIKAKGPNIQINAACSSTTVAMATAEDWIRTGRARRVIVVAGDDVTTEESLEWIVSGLFAVGAATTEGDVRNAAIPFDKRRNGMIAGMGAVGIVIEAESEIRKRGMEPITELVATEVRNSAFHVTRLDPGHISSVMEKLIGKVEKRLNIKRDEIADKLVFFSHETYTPARGGSASAEVESLRSTFGADYKDVVISNTKGFTGHSMGVGIEDAAVIKALQTGRIPPIANYKVPDPELGDINLSKGGLYENIIYGLRLGAGFGSQIAMSFMRVVSKNSNRVVEQETYRKWMRDVSGIENPELEIVNRTLRLKDDGSPIKREAEERLPEVKAESMKIDTGDEQAARANKRIASAESLAEKRETDSPASGKDKEIRSRICSLVAEKTGYPEDMIEFDLEMESDLGIDTVKQAELFGTIREMFSIPKQENLMIKDYPTLNHVVEFVVKNAGGIAPEDIPPVTPRETDSPHSGQEEKIRSTISSLVAEKTGYPEDMIEFDLEMESDLGIDTVKQAELFGTIREMFSIPKQENLMIKDYPTLNHVVEFVVKNAGGIVPEETPPVSPRETDSPHSGQEEKIRSTISSLVAEKTGYPEDMIEFDLEMESDLGIDTVKQAELFGTIREMFSIPKQENLMIKDYPTLNHVVEFVVKNAGGIVPEEIDSGEEIEERTEHESRIRRMILQMAEEPLNKDRNSRFDLNGFNILITDDGRGVARALLKKLKESNAHAEIMALPANDNSGSLIQEIERIKGSGSFNGIVHLVPLEESKDIDTIDFEEWRVNTFRRVKSLFLMVQSLQGDLTENAKRGEAFIVAATPMGGRFGINDFAAPDPIGGGITGLMKSLNKELEGVLVKSIDFSMRMKPATVAKAILNEIQWGGDTVEVGHAGSKRMIPYVVPEELDRNIEPRLNLEKGAVFVITGGGYGITGEIAKDIAKTFKPRIAIISRQGLPANIEELASLDDDGLKGLRDTLIEELKSSHERVTPVMIEREYGKYTAAIEKYKNVQEMKKLGAEHIEYYPCDVADHEQMSETIRKIRENYGKIDAIIHGAGIDQSKLLEDKKYEDFSRVFDVKADGCFNLIELTRGDDIKLLVAFSSIAGRFGNAGQTDYAAANDLLNKYVQHSIQRFNGKMKGVSINWTGWKEVGMVTRGSLMKIFEEGGVDLITVNEGVQRLRDEILYGDTGEVVIAGNVGAIDSDGIITNGNERELRAAAATLSAKKDEYPLIDEILVFEEESRISVRKRLDPTRDIYLQDHAIENVPHLPAVMGIEVFAEATNLLFPDMRIQAMRDIQFKLPIKILRGKPVDIIVTIEKTESPEDAAMLSGRIETEFFNRDGIKLGDKRLHFSAEILLSGDKGTVNKSRVDGASLDMVKQFQEKGKIKIDRNEIYQRFFHGPRFQVHGGVISINDNMIVGVVAEKSGDIFSFVKRPRMISNPLAIEAVLQNAGIWGMVQDRIVSLPDAIEELTFQPIPGSVDNLFIGARHTGSGNNRHIYEAGLFDSSGTLFASLRGYTMITTGSLEEGDELRF